MTNFEIILKIILTQDFMFIFLCCPLDNIASPCLSSGVFALPEKDGYIVWHADSIPKSKTDSLFLNFSIIGDFKSIDHNQKTSNHDEQTDKNTKKLQKCTSDLKSQIKMESSANRIACISNSNRYLIACLLDTGNVEVFSAAHRKIMRPRFKPKKASTIIGKTEGFAIDWIKSATHLAFGDNSGQITITDMESNGKTILSSNSKFKAHLSSVEDIHWSPDCDDIFASCSSDKHIKFWDKRCNLNSAKPVLETQSLHKSDINVFSWNSLNANLIVSGDENGRIIVNDVRKFPEGRNGSVEPVKCLRMFKWHQSPIASLEWNPFTGEDFVCASTDDTVTLWEISSSCINEPQSKKAKMENPPNELYFDHRGVTEPREVHWLDKDGILVTDLKGLDIFYPIDE